MRPASSVVDEVRHRTDINMVIGQRVRLVSAGPDRKGNCPFHPDEQALFYVSKRKQFFYCFGCKAAGDVIGFLMNFEQRDFWDVVATLADRAHVDLQPTTDADQATTPEEADVC